MADTTKAYRPIGDETLTLDGKTQHRAIANSDEVNFGQAQDFTVAVWVCPAPEQPNQQANEADIVEKWSGTGGYPFVIRYLTGEANRGKISAARYDGQNNPNVRSTTVLDDRRFHHVAFVRRTKDGKGVLELYVDGTLEDSAPDTTTGKTKNDSPLYLGCRGLAEGAGKLYFAGKIRDLRIYGEALSRAEIVGLASATGTPNILLIVADDLGADAVRIDHETGKVTVQIVGPDGKTAGPKRLENLEKLLKHGLHFSRAWAQPVCSATRGSLFTGLQPWRTGVGYPNPGGKNTLDEKPKSGAKVRSLAQVLKQASYRCGMFGKWHLGQLAPDDERPEAKPAEKHSPKKTPWDWGWERFAGILDGGFRAVGPRYGYSQGRMQLSDLTMKAPPQDRATVEPDVDKTKFANKRKDVGAATRTYLEKVNPGFVEKQPDVQYYIWEKCYEDDPSGKLRYDRPATDRTHMYATLDQVESAKNWLKQVLGSPWCAALTLTIPHDPFHVPPKESYTIEFANPEAPTIQEMFVAMVESMDFYIGRFLNSTEPEIREQLKNTVIVFVGDNGTQDIDPDRGEALLDADNEDKATPHIGAVHVPMMIVDGGSMFAGKPCYLSSAAIGGTTSDLVHVIDLFKTCAAIAGTSAPEGLDSISLKHYLKGGSGDKREFTFSQQFGYHKYGPGGQRTTDKFALVSDGKHMLSCARSKFVDADESKDEYEYALYELVPHQNIVGALREKEIKHFADDPASRAVAKKLFEEMKKHRLDGGRKEADVTLDPGPARDPLPFPPLKLESSWESLGGDLSSTPAVSSWASGRLDVFVRGKDNTLFHKYFDDAWSTWESLGGALTSGPAAVSWGNRRIDVFARGQDNELVHKYFDGTWHPWESLGGALTSKPAVCSWASGRLDVFARGQDNELLHKYFNGTWSGWESLGGVLSSAPAAVSWGERRIDVVAHGQNGALLHKYFNGAWSDWESLGLVPSTGEPAVASWAARRLDVFARGKDDTLMYKYFDGTWSGWESLGGGMTSGPGAVSWGDRRIDVFARGPEGALLHKWYKGSWLP
ncbi:LamG-like jellyroll fold domain-containing protein [Sorangium sp. So ce296]|uniref:LamG-like jellyroll fold domain-containing protein n=1 Tax=Sorangium sp. So ce296 TaxID=3133296 RepID=UPI003F63E7C1